MKPKENNTETKDVKFSLRIPPDMNEWIQQQAKKNHRSANAQIISWIQEIKDRQTNQPNA